MPNKTNPNEFCVAICGCLCLSEKKEHNSWSEFAHSYLRGINDVLNNKLAELKRATYRRPFVVKTENIVNSYTWRVDESFVEFKQRVRPEIFESIKQAIRLWWQQLEKMSDRETTSTNNENDSTELKPLSSISAPPYNPTLIPIPDFWVEFGGYPEEFDGFRQKEKCEGRIVYWGDYKKTRIEYFRDKKKQDAQDFVNFIISQIPLLAEEGKRIAMTNFNLDIKALTFSHRKESFSCGDWGINTTAAEFGNYVKDEVEKILAISIIELENELAEEDSWIDGEVDPNFGRNIPPLDDESTFEEMLKAPPEWFMK